MRLVDDPELFKQQCKLDRFDVKFVCIGDKFYGVAIDDLLNSKEFQQLPLNSLRLTSNFLNSLPRPTSPIHHFRMALLEKCPVVMFETPNFDHVYFRMDGRHRCLGAASKGYEYVPAMFVPRSIWGKYIYGYKVSGQKYNAVAFTWDRPPNTLGTDLTGVHYEPNFVFKSNMPKDDSPSSSNVGLALSVLGTNTHSSDNP